MHLLKRAPELASRTLVIDRAVHPRPKLCGGGLTGISQALLDRLDLDMVLNYVPIHEIVIRFEIAAVKASSPTGGDTSGGAGIASARPLIRTPAALTNSVSTRSSSVTAHPGLRCPRALCRPRVRRAGRRSNRRASSSRRR